MFLERYSPPGLEEVLVGQPGTCQLPIILAHFGTPSVKSLFRWLFLTIVQTYLRIPTHELLLDDYRIRLPVMTPFTPASGIDG